MTLPSSSEGAPFRLASLRRRLGALLYETLLLTALVFVVGFITLPMVSGRGSGANVLALPTVFNRVILFCCEFGAVAAYCVWFWSNGRRTLAQKTWHLRVVDRVGAPLSTRLALARYLACWIGPALAFALALTLRPFGLAAYAAWLIGFNFLWAVIDRERLFLHDRIAGTRVVAE